MLTRALLVLTLLFGVFAMHQVAQPASHDSHEDPGLHLCVGLVVIAAGLIALRKSKVTAAPSLERSVAVLLPRVTPVVVSVPTRLVVLRL